MAEAAFPKRLCVQWPRFGPYHLARLEAAHRYLVARGVELIGLETAGRDATYAWRVEAGGTSFRREQVFPGALYEELTPQAMHRGIVAALDRLQPDAMAINSYSLPDARACLAWCIRNRRVAVCMTDSKADDAQRTPLREWLKSILVRAFDAALLAGTPQREYFLDLCFPPDAILLGYDVVDNAFFGQYREAHPASAAPYFLAVNRFLPVKNLDGLLDAYRQYRQQAWAPWPLVLVGDGPERSRLERRVAEQAIDGVAFEGFQQINALTALYGRAGAFVHPTFKDTWGLVVNEAMAAGLPVLVSDRAGCTRDLVGEGVNGFVFDPENPARLADLLRRVSEMPDAERAAMGRHSQEIIADWSPERFSESLWEAVQIGRQRNARPRRAARLLLGLLRLAARRIDSFQAVEV